MASPTGISSPILQPPLKGPLIAFIASDAAGNGYILLLDLTTDSTRRFQWIGDTPGTAEWWTDGCGLNVSLATSSGVELVSTDLKNNKSQKVFSGGERADGSYAAWPVLSPDKKWVAYTVLSGQQQYIGAEFQNVEIVAVENQTQPFVLTKRGGAWKAAWSPDGEYLAYSDYDTAGVAQLYRSKPDGSERVQLTHFKMDGITIGPARWSPLGDKIAFAIDEDNGPGSVWIAFADGSKQFKTSASGTIMKTDDFWWDEDGQRLAFNTRKNEKRGVKEDTVYWISAANGKVLHLLKASEAPEGYISRVFPVDGIRVIGFVGGDRLIFYNVETRAIEEKRFVDVETDDLTGPVYASPITFQGETTCLKGQTKQK